MYLAHVRSREEAAVADMEQEHGLCRSEVWQGGVWLAEDRRWYFSHQAAR